MGSVWRATQVSLRAPVAVKFLKGPPDAARTERFVREARIAASLSHHPHVVRMLDEGATEDGEAFIVMELLEGESLGARLAREPPLGVRELLRYAGETLSALGAAHALGVVHRDLKPENVFLARTDHGVTAKLLDFGVARPQPVAALAVADASLTETGCTVGTPWYMAPEQARGRPVDGRADLFSVGVILYRALAGRLPFDGLTLADVMLNLVQGRPAALVELRPELGLPLSDAVARALRSERDDRFADAGAMRAALDDAAATTPADLAAAVWSHAAVPCAPSTAGVPPAQWFTPLLNAGAAAAGESPSAVPVAVPNWGRDSVAGAKVERSRVTWPLAVAALVAAFGAVVAVALWTVSARPPSRLTVVERPMLPSVSVPKPPLAPAVAPEPVHKPEPRHARTAPPRAFRTPGF